MWRHSCPTVWLLLTALTATLSANGRPNLYVPLRLEPSTSTALYSVPVGVGTPQQTLRMVVDTGTAGALIFDRSKVSQCRGRPTAPSSITCFDASGGKSSTFDGKCGARKQSCDTHNYVIMVDWIQLSTQYRTVNDRAMLRGLAPAGGQRELTSETYLRMAEAMGGDAELYWRQGLGGQLGLCYPYVGGTDPDDSQDQEEKMMDVMKIWMWQSSRNASANGTTALGSTLKMSSINAREVGSSQVFALDFGMGLDKEVLCGPAGSAKAAGCMHVGGYEHEALGEVAWSQMQPNEPREHHELPMFGMSMCGADLLSNYSSHWWAIIDTGASCLSLPAEFYDMLLAWIPPSAGLTCPKRRKPVSEDERYMNAPPPNTDMEQNELCYVKHATTLPWLSFRMSENRTSAPLQIRLEDLLLPPDAQGRRKLCMRASGHAGMSGNQRVERISLGTMVLRSFYTVFDTANGRVGMAPRKSSEGRSPLLGCAKPLKCVGAQSIYAPLNKCLDPPCELGHFQEVDPDTKRCHVQRSFKATAVALIALIVAVDVGVQIFYEQAISNSGRGTTL